MHNIYLEHVSLESFYPLIFSYIAREWSNDFKNFRCVGRNSRRNISYISK